MNEEKKKIEKLIKEFFGKMSSEEKPRIEKIENNIIFLELETKTPDIFIGKHGVVLDDIQLILGKIIKRQVSGEFFVDLDINHYKQNKTEYLKGLAQNLANEAFLEKQEKVLPIMTPRERRVVHIFLGERADVETESIGEEPERRIVIKPKTSN